MKTNPILITGSHRSGTTWVAKMIALSWYVFYLEEPFNQCYDHISHELLPQQFYYIRSQYKTPKIKKTIDNILTLSQPFHAFAFPVLNSGECYAQACRLNILYFAKSAIPCANRWTLKAYSVVPVITLLTHTISIHLHLIRNQALTTLSQ